MIVVELLLRVDIVDAVEVVGSVLVAFSFVDVASVNGSAADTVVDGSNILVVVVCARVSDTLSVVLVLSGADVVMRRTVVKVAEDVEVDSAVACSAVVEVFSVFEGITVVATCGVVDVSVVAGVVDIGVVVVVSGVDAAAEV